MKSERERQILYTGAYVLNLENDTDELTVLWTQGVGGEEGEMYGESNMETYTIVCKIDSQQEFAVMTQGTQTGLSNDLEGWDGDGVGRDVQATC